MIEVTGTAQHEAWFARTSPPVERVGEHVWSIPVACDPFPVRYTLAYAVANDAGEFVVVDPGWDSPGGREQLADGLRLAGLAPERLVGVVVTHFHPDHIGMSQRLADTTGAWIGMHPRDALPSSTAPGDAAAAVEADRSWLERCGVPDATLGTVVMSAAAFRSFSRPRAVPSPLADGDRIALAGRDVQVVWTPGHSAGHICLVDHDDRLVLTGDHVLPRISPNVGLGFHDDDDRDAVGEYLASLAAIAEWTAFEACPAHEWRFRGLGERCTALIDHHRDRGREVEAVLAADPGASMWEVAGRLTWSRGWSNLDASGIRGALAETVAHVRHLERARA